MGGIGLQQLFIFLFVFVTIKFHRELLRQSLTDRIRQALVLLYVVYAALFLITVSPSYMHSPIFDLWLTCFDEPRFVLFSDWSNIRAV